MGEKADWSSIPPLCWIHRQTCAGACAACQRLLKPSQPGGWSVCLFLGKRHPLSYIPVAKGSPYARSGLPCAGPSRSSRLASRQQDSHVGIYWQELGCWFPDPCMTQLHIVLHPVICLAYLCAFAGTPFPSPPMDPWQPSKISAVPALRSTP